MSVAPAWKRRGVPCLAVVLLVSSAFAAQDPPQRERRSRRDTLVFTVRDAERTVTLTVPRDWSLDPMRFRNSRLIVHDRPATAQTRPARIQVFVEPRADHADALKQMQELGSMVAAEHKTFLTIGGWPALRIQRVETPPPPSHSRPHDEPTVLRVQTYIAAGDMLVVVAGTLPPDASRELIDGVIDIAGSLTFQTEGDPAAVEEELRRLRAPVLPQDLGLVAPSALPAVRMSAAPEKLGGPESGSNERIDANGFGELEVATSPDGRHVVVALQSRFFVSSNDFGASFPNTGRIGAGNGDPSVAWGQSGRFYIAWIDGSSNSTTNICAANYLNAVTAPDLFPPAGPDPAPNGMDCTGMSRSDDNGVSFQTNTVNPAVVCIGAAPTGSPANPGQCFPDQEHIAADRVNPGSAPNDDQVYSTWRNFTPTGQNAALVCSQDSGVTWSAPFEIGANEFFPRITVGQDGFVYVASYNNLGMFRLYKYTSCANGLALVAGFPQNVAARTAYDCPFAGHDRCDQNPTSQVVAVDDTDPNHVYYAYVEDAAAAGSDSNIFVRDSVNGGLAWPAARVAQANPNVDARRVMPWLCTTGGDAVVTWYEQRQPVPSDVTHFFGGQVGLDAASNLVSRESFRISEVADSWCGIGWPCQTRWGNTDTQTSNASEACPVQPQLAGQCGDGDNPNVTPDSGIACDFSDDDGVTFTSCPTAATSPSGNNELCLPGGGCPKYGDYSGVACAGGKLFAAWASAASPPGVPPAAANRPGVLFDVINLDVEMPVITVPGAVTLADACVGSSSVATLDVCNTGSANLQVDVITSDNPQFAVTIPSSGFPVTISPDFCFPFQVRFTPSGIGPASATFTIPSNDPARPEIEVEATARGGEPNVATLIANAGSFGDVCRDAFKDLDLTIGNTGACDLVVDLVSSNSADFVVAGTVAFPLTVSPGNSLQVPIRFAPTTLGPKAGTIRVDTNDPQTPARNVAVSGNVPPGDIRVTGSTDFGDVCGGTQAEKTITVCNLGACALAVTSVAFNPACVDFTLVDNPFPATLPPGACQDVVIAFTPTSPGPKSCTLVVTSDDPDTPIVSRTVTANTPGVSIDVPPDLGFPPTVVQTVGACRSALPFPVSNTGQCPLIITDLAITAGTGEFSTLGLPSFPIILEPGHVAGEGDLDLVFTPAVLDRDRLGTVRTTYVSNPITGATTSVDRALCGEGVQTGARVLVRAAGVPLAEVEQIRLNRINANRNKPMVDTVDNARDLPLQEVVPTAPCGRYQYHREYGPVSNPIQLLPGSYEVTVTAIVGGRRVHKTVAFDVDTCGFNSSIVVDF